MVEFLDLNFEKDIGANSTLIKFGPFNVIVDCGMDPKRTGYEAIPGINKLEKNSVDLVVLTHCHLDHVGSMPVLMRNQANAKLLLSEATAAIIEKMLLNSFSVMRRQKEEKGVEEYPLYSKGEILDLKKSFNKFSVEKSKKFHKKGEELEVTFLKAGHVIGAASVLFKYNNKQYLFTGDILFRDQRTVQGALIPMQSLEAIFLETTRGEKSRPIKKSAKLEEERLIGTLQKTIEAGGSCLIPSFALGRMQEMLKMLYKLKKSSKLPNCPIYCSGLGYSLTDEFDKVSRKSQWVNFDKKILKALKVKVVDAKKLYSGAKLKSPGIYLLSSGMLVENTPAYCAAAQLVSDAKNSICFVGFCHEDTPGYKLQQVEKNENFCFETIDVDARVCAQIESFDLSGHADRDELLEFVVAQNPSNIVLTHGSSEAREWFETEFNTVMPESRCINPTPRQLYKLD